MAEPSTALSRADVLAAPARGGGRGSEPTPQRSQGDSPHRSGRAHRRPTPPTWWGFAPFVAFLSAFFLLPCALVLLTAFQRADPTTGVTAFSLQNWVDSLTGIYRTGLLNSLQLALVTAVVSAVAGLLIAWQICGLRSTFVRQAVSSSSAVLANFGGLPLAFLFVAVLGTAGVLTTALHSWFGVNLDDLHFSLYSLKGVELVYLYFLIPLMVLVITPALEGIRPQWREAAASLGARPWQYWRLVVAPVLAPSLLGSLLLLFCSSLSAFATASALTNGTLAITPLQIDTAVSGNVLVGQDNLAAALALNMILIVVPLTLAYQALQRRTSRWLR